MKKLASWLSLLLIQAFALAGCGFVEATMQPTHRTQPPLPTISQAIVTIATSSTLTSAVNTPKESIATLSPTILSTPVDTLEPEIVRATLEPLLSEPLNCAVPCFWGIIPGKTDFYKARSFFGRLGFMPFEGKDPNSGRDFYSIEYETSLGLRSNVTLIPSSHIVANIIITPDIDEQTEGSPRKWIAYSPETLIKKYGKPSRVELAIDRGPNFVIVMIMYFDVPHLIALYSGYNMIPDRPHSPQVCPLTAPFDLVRLWLGPNPPNPPTMETVVLEKATSLTVDQFTKLMLSDPQRACFIVNGDIFR